MMLDDAFGVVVAHVDGRPLVQLSGEIDLASAPTFREAVMALLEVGQREIVLDLAGVTFMDSTAISVIVEVLRAGAWIDVASISDVARRTLDLAGILDLCVAKDPRTTN